MVILNPNLPNLNTGNIVMPERRIRGKAARLPGGGQSRGIAPTTENG